MSTTRSNVFVLLSVLLCATGSARPAHATASVLVSESVAFDFETGYQNVYYGGDDAYLVAGEGTGLEAKYHNTDDPNFHGASIHAAAYSYGGPGFARADAYAQMIQATPTTDLRLYSLFAGGLVRVTVTDVVVSGPPGPITTRVHLHLDGGFFTGTTFVPHVSPDEDFFAATNADNYIGVSLTVTDGYYPGGRDIGSGSFGINSHDGSFPTTSLESGWLTGFDGDVDLISDGFLVDANTPFTLELMLDSRASVSGPIDRGLDLFATTNFYDTLSFAVDQPVFDLPAGYSADSVEGNIVGNTFSVPEPSRTDCLAAGVGALLFYRRRSAHRIQPPRT